MSISSTDRKAGPYACNGAQVVFDFAFKVFEASDLRVVKTDSSAVETDLTLTTHYTVSLNADQDANPGGTITTVAAYATGNKITITSEVPETQGVNITNLGGFYPAIINKALDRLTILVQQLAEKVARAPKVDISSTDTPEQLLTDIFAAETNSAASAAAASTSATNAAASATSAASSASSASTSASSAASSASSAGTSATSAASSATAAATSATAAQTAETNASGSATSASGSASAAAASATAASGSASAAATSATNAANSASAAATSETNAAGSASGAATSATAASNSAGAASTSATSASASATAASGSASAAATSATNASNSASAASTSASNAATSATNASNSATSAAASATEAAGYLTPVTATSTSSVAVGTGSKSFTIETGKAYVAGHPIKVAQTSAPTTNYMTGTVTSYNSGTRLAAPVYGCIVIFSRQGGGHVGPVMGVDKQGRLLVMGGNQKDAVSIAPFDRVRVLAYVWPPGQAFTNTALPVLDSSAASSTNEA